MAKYMEELEDMICEELDKIAKKGELSAGSLEAVQKLSHSLKSLKTIEAMEGHSGYSNTYPMRSYDMYDGYSNARRDSMGRYSRESREYSRDGSFESELRGLMDEAPNDRIRRKMQTILAEMQG